MTKENWLYTLVGLLVGIVLSVLYVNLVMNQHHSGMMRGYGKNGGMMSMMGGGMYEVHHEKYNDEPMMDAMHGMTMGLDGKTGDGFDRAFIQQMILHHEGAVEMANAALNNAKHDEIKQMANDIISAQTKEINQMKEWQKAWYGK